MSHRGIHIFEQTVRFEDVDPLAMVYHPIYLSYIERARCQYLIEKGNSFKKMIEAGFGMVVASVEMKYIRPLQLDDRFFVATQIDQRAKSILHMTQIIAMRPEDCARSSLKEELRHIDSLRFYAHLKLIVISMHTRAPVTPPDWMAEVL